MIRPIVHFAAVMIVVGLLVPFTVPSGHRFHANGSRAAFWLLATTSLVSGLALLTVQMKQITRLVAISTVVTTLVWSQQEIQFDGQVGLVENCGSRNCESKHPQHVGLRVAQLVEALFRDLRAPAHSSIRFKSPMLTPALLGRLPATWANARCTRVDIIDDDGKTIRGFIRVTNRVREALVMQFDYAIPTGELTPMRLSMRGADGSEIEIPRIDSHYHAPISGSTLLRAYEGTSMRGLVLYGCFVWSLLCAWIALERSPRRSRTDPDGGSPRPAGVR